MGDLHGVPDVPKARSVTSKWQIVDRVDGRLEREWWLFWGSVVGEKRGEKKGNGEAIVSWPESHRQEANIAPDRMKSPGV